MFTEVKLVYKPTLIIVTALGICISRWAAVFPLSKLLNFIHKVRARALNRPVPEELPKEYQMMLFWAGLRGAVGVALAAGLEGEDSNALRATVLVVVVLTVIVFGGTTSRMLEILGIQTGVETEVDSDDELDVEIGRKGPLINANYGFPEGSSGQGGRRATLPRLSDGKARRSPDTSPKPSSNSLSPESTVFPHRSSIGDTSVEIEHPPSFSRTTSMEPSVSSNSGGSSSLISGALPSLLSRTAEDHVRWFQNFDEHVSLFRILL